MNSLLWHTLETPSDLELALAQSVDYHVAIFKHSTRCGLSSMTLNSLESNWKPEETRHLKAFYLDLVAHRNISQQIAEQLGVVHQSPQILLIKDGACYYSASHIDISYKKLIEAAGAYRSDGL
jgi:bacillithiol system protein YtxJ